jgi:putative hydrolase of the HAD superfamily
MKDWAEVESWVFDLDNTLYPAASTIYDAVEARMNAFIARALGLDLAGAIELRERYFHQYGATVVGLARHHGIDAHAFLDDVHDVSFDALAPDAELNALIAALPGRKFVFTNGGGAYARAVLKRLGLAPSMDAICDIESAGLAPKPQPEAYARLVARCALDPARAVLIEDTPRNLAPAHALEFRTVLVGPAPPTPMPPYITHWAQDLTTLLRAQAVKVGDFAGAAASPSAARTQPGGRPERTSTKEPAPR